MKQKNVTRTLMLLALLFNLCSLKASGQWSAIAVKPGINMDECFSFSLHGKGYVGGGSADSNFYSYDTTTNAWTHLGSSPGHKWRGAGMSFVLNNHGYAGCGDTTGMDQGCGDLWMYNDTTNAWTSKASFPGGGRAALIGFSIGDTAYAGCGANNGYLVNDFYKYNPFTDTWTPLSPLPFGAASFSATFIIGGKAYVATGQIGTIESTGLWEYDPGTDTWIAKASYPGPAKQAAFSFVIDNYAYVGGGTADFDTTFTDMWRYDPVANSWYPAPAFPSIYAAFSAAFTVGNIAYVGTGSSLTEPSLVRTDSFHRYRGVANPDLGVSNTGASNASPVTVYPNPANDFIYLSGLDYGTEVALYDLTGREIKRLTEAVSTIFIGDLTQGIYILKATNAAGNFMERITKK